MNYKTIVALLLGILIGQCLSSMINAGQNGWADWQINRVIMLLEHIDSNTQR